MLLTLVTLVMVTHKSPFNNLLGTVLRTSCQTAFQSICLTLNLDACALRSIAPNVITLNPTNTRVLDFTTKQTIQLMWTSDKLTEEDSGFLAIGNQKINLNVLSKMYFIFW